MNKLKITLVLFFSFINLSLAFTVPTDDQCKLMSTKELLDTNNNDQVLKACYCKNQDKRTDAAALQAHLDSITPALTPEERQEYLIPTLEMYSEVCKYANFTADTPCIYKTTSAEKTRDRVKRLDQNNNCEIDGNAENCILRFDFLMSQADDTQKLEYRRDKFGCYGNESEPRNLKDAISNYERTTSSFEVLDSKKGLISNEGQQGVLQNIIQTEQGGPIVGLINFIIDYLVSIVFVLCMASLIYGGYNLMFAGLDSEMIEKGKNAIKYAIFGFVFIMLSYTITILVQSIF